jgi:branched-chain amino acid transport system substrate-binding protein
MARFGDSISGMSSCSQPSLVRRTILSLTAAVACQAAVHAAEPGVSATEITIGQNISLQGAKNRYGVAALDGVKLYLDAVNAAGGVHGRQIVLRTLDDDTKSPVAEANARKLVAEGAFILFASQEGGPSTAVAKVAEELRVPFFGPMAGSPNLRRPHSPMVFPVRAEHRDEFRALMEWGRRTGLKTVGFFHADSDVGRAHLENVKIAAAELGMSVTLALPFKGDISDLQLDEMAGQIIAAQPDVMLNHGSAGVYGKLITRVRKSRAKTTFMAVNSGSTQLAADLGSLAHGMVFSQVVPSPWERKHPVSREYQEAMAKNRTGVALSYGGLEGYLTAKALVMALQATGKNLTRASFVAALERSTFDLGGVTLRYSNKSHDGSRFVDLSMYSREDRFIH